MPTNETTRSKYVRVLKTVPPQPTATKSSSSKLFLAKKSNIAFPIDFVVSAAGVTWPILIDSVIQLAKGENFSVTPHTIPTEETISNIEAGIEKPLRDVKEEVCSESARILRKAKPPNSNISGGEKAAIRSLNEDKNIIILPADKGNTTFVMKHIGLQEQVE
ncbi:unnamed protein product [Psylliodes chrysocephalus]|uniref:Uncharacterized protein n=1 Tax=Psylliodes chrysocephalus TaxID=3402493 RepID=A0A9P0D2A7_9CUCU|nr:unnamed protein product [Psylliodes chrysocephala]